MRFIGTRSINSSPRFTQAWLRLIVMLMPGLVEKYESAYRDATYRSDESGALRDYVAAQILQRPSALFFTT